MVLGRAAAIGASLALQMLGAHWVKPEGPARGWIAPIRITTRAHVLGGTQLLYDSQTGDVHVFWCDNLSGTTAIAYRRWIAESQMWTPTQNLSSSPWSSLSPSACLEADGTMHLVWCQIYAASEGAPADGTDILYRRYERGYWSEAQVIHHDPFYLTGGYQLVLLKAQDRLYAFASHGLASSYMYQQDGMWTDMAPWDYRISVYTGAVEGDTIHLAGFGLNSSQWMYDRYFVDAYYTRFDGQNFSEPVNISSVDGVAQDVALAIDGSGQVHLVWTDTGSPFSSESQGSALYERVWAGGEWGPNLPISTPNPNQAVRDVELVSDEAGGLHLAWSEGLLEQMRAIAVNLHYAHNDGRGWGSEEVILPSETSRENLALDATASEVYLTWMEGETPPEQALYFSTTDPSVYDTPLYPVYLPWATRPEGL